MKNIKRIFCGLIILAISISMISCDSSKASLDAIVAKVNGTEINRGQVEELMMKDFYSQLGSYANQFLADMGEEKIIEYRHNTLDIIVQQEVARQKAEELGMYDLTTEEQTEVNGIIDSKLLEYDKVFTAELKKKDADSGVFEEVIEAKDYSADAREELKKYLEENFKYTIGGFDGSDLIEKFKAYVTDDFVVTVKLMRHFTYDITVEEKEVKDEYDKLMTQQKTSFNTDITKYEEMYVSSKKSTIVYIPKGLRYVKHIVTMFPENDVKSLNTLYSRMNSDRTRFHEAEDALNKANDDKSKQTAQTNYDQAKEAFDLSNKSYSDALELSKPAINEKINTIFSKVQSGEDFNKLIDEYNEDEGMNTEPAKTEGYLISNKTSNLYYEFINAGMSIKETDEYSNIFYTPAGAHVIKLISVVDSVEKPYTDVKVSIEDSLLQPKKNAKFAQQVKEWMNSSEIQEFEEAIISVITTVKPSES